MNLVRILEKLTGQPHNHHHADRVADAVAELGRDVRKLSDALRPYSEASDPMVALMTDVFNDRQLKNGGAHNGK